MMVERTLTQTGAVVGTPSYMSPEQLRGDEVDRRTDLYSFAAVCYEALTGRCVVSGDDFGAIVINVLREEPPAVSELLPGSSPELDRLFASALAKNVTERENDIERWGLSLAEALERSPVDAATTGWNLTDPSPLGPGRIADSESPTEAHPPQS